MKHRSPRAGRRVPQPVEKPVPAVEEHARRATPDRWITPRASTRTVTRGDGQPSSRPPVPASRAPLRPGQSLVLRCFLARRPPGSGRPRQPTGPSSGRATRTTQVDSVEHARPQLEHDGARAPEAPQGRPGLRHLVAVPTLPSSRPARPRRPPAAGTSARSRSSGATARAVTTSHVRRPCISSARPRSTSTRSPSPRRVDDLVQEARTPQQRLDQRHRQVRPGDRQRQARAAPRPSPTSTTRGPVGDHLAEDRAVQQVPVPQARRLARSDQPAQHPVGRQQVGVPLGHRQPVGRRTPAAPRGCDGCFT